MKLLVTGANGYLGQGVVNRLLDYKNDVIATDFRTENIDMRTEKIAGDLFEIEDPYTYFNKPDILLHLAWRDGFKHYSDTHVEDLPKHYCFIKKMIESGIKKVAAMGSMHEIGFFEGSINENTPCHPITPYGISKNAFRDLTQMLAQKNGTKFQWLRGYYIVGNSKFGSSVFSKLAVAAENGDKEFPFTLGQNQYDFIDYEIFCDQVAAAVQQDKVNGIIEICSGIPEKLADKMEQFIKDNDFRISLNYGAFPDRPYDSKAIWGDNNKISHIMKDIEKELNI